MSDFGDRIYVWNCNGCEAKGATNVKPSNPKDLECIRCGENLNVQCFKRMW